MSDASLGDLAREFPSVRDRIEELAQRALDELEADLIHGDPAARREAMKMLLAPALKSREDRASSSVTEQADRARALFTEMMSPDEGAVG